MQFCRNYLFKNHCSGKYGTRTRPNASKAKHQHGHRFNPRGKLPRAKRAGAQLQSGVGERTGFGVAEPLGMRQIPSCPRVRPKSGARLARRAKDQHWYCFNPKSTGQEGQTDKELLCWEKRCRKVSSLRACANLGCIGRIYSKICSGRSLKNGGRLAMPQTSIQISARQIMACGSGGLWH